MANDPYDQRIGNGALPQGIWGSANRAYVRNTNNNELVSNQLNQLTAQNGQYLQQARQQAQAAANARGLGNSSYAAGNAQAAAIRAALPIAQADATAFQNTAEQNQRWLNQQQMALEANQTSRANSASSNQAQIEATRMAQAGQLQRQRENLAYEGEQAGLGRSFQEYMTGLNQGYGLQNMAAQDYYRGNDEGRQDYYNAQNWGRNIYGNTIGSVLNTTLSNPDYFQDPNAAFGMLSGFSGYIGNMLGNYFGQNGYFGG